VLRPTIAVPGKVIQTQGHDMKDENRQRQRHRGKRRQQKSLDTASPGSV